MCTESDIYVCIVVGKDMDINEHDRLSNVRLRHKVKEQLVVRKYIDVNEHEKLCIITLDTS